MTRITLILMMAIGWLAFVATALAQPAGVTLDGEYTLEEALDHFSEQTGIDYTFNPDRFAERKIQLHITGMQPDLALGELSKAYGFQTRKQRAGQMVLTPVQQQPRRKKKPTSQLKGRLRAPDGSRLSNALVELPEFGLSTRTSTEGLFSITVPSPSVRTPIVVSAEGMPPIRETIRIRQSTVLALHMQRAIAVVQNETKDFFQHLTDVGKHFMPVDTAPKWADSGTHRSSQHRAPVQVSVWPDMGTQKMTPTSDAPAFLAALPAGSAYGLQGIAVGLLYTKIHDDAEGFMLNSTINYVGGTMNGFQGAGALNRSDGLNGIQLAGALNMAGDGYGSQTAGAANLSKSFIGTQISGGLNLAHDLRGAQVTGGLNLARGMAGIQLAPINVARRVRGLQLGVINLADSSDGFSFGVINLVAKGRHAFTFSANANSFCGLTYENGNGRYVWCYGLYWAGTKDYPLQKPMAAWGTKLWPWKKPVDHCFYLPRLGLMAYAPLGGSEVGNFMQASGELEFRVPLSNHFQAGLGGQLWLLQSFDKKTVKELPTTNVSSMCFSDTYNRMWATVGLSLTYVL